MEANEVVTYVAMGGVAVSGFFIRKVLSDIDRLKRADLKNLLAQQEIKSNKDLIDKNETSMYKKFTAIHVREDKQRELNTDFKVLFGQINEKLDQLIANK